MNSKKIQIAILGLLKYFALAVGAFVAIIPVLVCVFTAFKIDD